VVGGRPSFDFTAVFIYLGDYTRLSGVAPNLLPLSLMTSHVKHSPLVTANDTSIWSRNLAVARVGRALRTNIHPLLSAARLEEQPTRLSQT
jgi:hypothetical protein